MLVAISDVWEDAADAHRDFLVSAVRTKVTEMLPIGPPRYSVQLALEFLAAWYFQIVLQAAPDFTNCVTDYDDRFPPGSPLRAEVNDIFSRVFDYNRFSKKKTPGWNAYALCSLARYRICPYCHMAAVRTEPPSAKGKGYRPDIDHFYSQARYPFLGLSLHNLIPSCESCNRTHKGSANFFAVPHLHPQRDAEVVKFRLVPASGREWTPLLSAFREPAEAYALEVQAPIGNAAASNAIVTFQLETRYADHLKSAYAVACIRKQQDWYKTAGEQCGFPIPLVAQLGFDPASTTGTYKKEMLGRMKLDIYQNC